MMKKRMTAFCILFALFAATAVFGQAREKDPLVFFIPAGYDLMRLENQTIHSPALGFGFILGEQDLPFDQVERRFFGMALYQPVIFSETTAPDVPELYHEIDAIFDGRLGRHQLLFILKSASNRPLFGGLNSIQVGAGWGYEIIRRPQVSLILGAVLGVNDFGITLPSGAVWPVLPLPLIRFGIDTQWFTSSFDYLTGPNFEFTVAPNRKLRLTGEMRMDNYRSIDDLVCEFTLWYRFFDKNHRMGDFAGIGAGFKSDLIDFNLSDVSIPAENFCVLQRSVFLALDLSILNIQGGWIFESSYLIDGEKNGSPGRGFFISVQGLIPIYNRGNKK